jgi:predicted deacetylase
MVAEFRKASIQELKDVQNITKSKTAATHPFIDAINIKSCMICVITMLQHAWTLRMTRKTNEKLSVRSRTI